MPVVSFDDKRYECASGRALLDVLPPGATMLEGAGDSCGFGVCGKCIVHVEGNVNDPTQKERARLSDEQLAADIRMSCQASVRGDVEVTEHRPDEDHEDDTASE